MSETPVDAPADAGGRERLLAKLNSVAGNIVRRRERHGEAPAGRGRLDNRRSRP